MYIMGGINMRFFLRKVLVICLIFILIVGGTAIYLFFGQLPSLSSENRYIGRTISMLVRLDDCDFEDYYIYSYFPLLKELHARANEGDSILRSRHLYNGATLKHGESVELRIGLDRYFSQRKHVNWRTLYRNDESVLIVYFNITEPPISKLRREYYHLFTGGIRTSPAQTPTMVLQDIDHFPQSVEIYFLQNLHHQQRRINRLTDERFDELRANAVPVWNGVIGITEFASCKD